MIAAQNVVVHVSGSDPATLILASLGVGLALASLLWQGLTFLISGSRVSVKVRVGLKGVGSVVTLPHAATPKEVQFMRSQGFTEPVFAVQVNNTGRGSTSVVSVDLVFEDGGAVGDAALDPPVPFTLVGESEQSWYLDARLASGYVKAIEQVKPTGQPRAARGRVKLGSKKVVISKNSIPIPPS